MTVETISFDLKIKMCEATPYSYTTNAILLMKKAFDDPELNDVRIIAEKLLKNSVSDDCLSKPITIGASAFDDKNACINRIIRETELDIIDSKSWSLLQRVLTNKGRPQQIIIELNELGLIDNNVNPWDLLSQLNSTRD